MVSVSRALYFSLSLFFLFIVHLFCAGYRTQSYRLANCLLTFCLVYFRARFNFCLYHTATFSLPPTSNNFSLCPHQPATFGLYSTSTFAYVQQQFLLSTLLTNHVSRNLFVIYLCTFYQQSQLFNFCNHVPTQLRNQFPVFLQLFINKQPIQLIFFQQPAFQPNLFISIQQLHFHQFYCFFFSPP